MTCHILCVSLFCNAYIALKYGLLMFLSLLFITFLLISCNFVTYCLGLIVQCNSALSMKNSALNLACTDDGSVNVYVYEKTLMLISDNHNYYDYDHHCK